jgi:hypothetical protein
VADFGVKSLLRSVTARVDSVETRTPRKDLRVHVVKFQPYGVVSTNGANKVVSAFKRWPQGSRLFKPQLHEIETSGRSGRTKSQSLSFWFNG